MAKVLFVTTRLPFPEDDGRRRLLYNYCRLLNDLGHEVGIVSLYDGSMNTLRDAPPFLSFVTMVEGQRLTTDLLRKCSLLWDPTIPLQALVTYSSKAQRTIDGVITDWNPALIICDMVRTTIFLEKWLGTFKVVANLDDLLSVRYSRQSDVSSIDLAWSGKKFGFLLMLPGVSKAFQSVLKIEASRLHRYENRVAERFSHTVLVSGLEAEMLSSRTSSSSISSWPMGFDVKVNKRSN